MEKNLVIENMKDRGIPSGAYADIILEFALEYGGGNDGSEIKFMHEVACHFGCSNVLGETFWTAVTKTVFAGKTRMFPLLRVALCLLQYVCFTSSGWHWQVAGEK